MTRAAEAGNALRQLNAGLELHRAGRLSEAVEVYRRVLTEAPNNADALHLLGVAARQVGRTEEALALIHQAIELAPGQGTFWNSLGTTLSDLGQQLQALASFDRAVLLSPALAEGHYNRGSLLRQSGRPAAAIDALGRALALRPDYADAHNDLGGVLLEQGEFEQARAHLVRSLALRPNSAEAHANLGLVLAAGLDFQRAHAHFDRAVALEPENGHAHWCRAVSLLRSGDLEPGWAEFEWRWKSGQLNYRPQAAPAWSGEPLESRRVLLWAEQGLGDTLQFGRYAALLARQGANVVLEVQPEVERLLRESLPEVEVIARGRHSPSFDVHAPLMSLPYVLGTRLDTIPAEVPYLTADPERVGVWADRLGPRDGRCRVGLVWSGSRQHKNNERRSIAPALLGPLAKQSGIEWVSLQKEPQQLPPLELTDRTAELTDFAETAALVMNLDLVISVDTSAAHVAAALGRPVWLLVAAPSCWRWLRDRTDTPWYPTMRLFRQTHPGDWSGVLSEVAAELACFPLA